MIKKLSVGIVVFSYGGNGGISSEVPDVREWIVPISVNGSKDPRIERLHVWTLSDTPITMTRNRAVLQAREMGLDVLVMVDSDMKPDMMAGQPGAKPFFDSSFEYIYNRYERGPVVIGAPYCGPPPHECVYVFRWQNRESNVPGPDYQLEMYDRHTASSLAGIQECAALPTGVIMYDMRVFELTEPKKEGDKHWFYYEFDLYGANKHSTEDVTNTRDISLAGVQQLGYNPVRCNWDAWAGHWKPKLVGKPQIIDAAAVSHKLADAAKAGFDSTTKLIHFEPSNQISELLANAKVILAKAEVPPPFDDMGLSTPEHDLEAIRFLARWFRAKYGRPPTVCEIGSWAGASALAWASEGAKVLCIDHWEGNKNDDGTKGYDGSRGTPHDVFKRNTAHQPLISCIVGHSLDVAKCGTRKFDIVYIDAEHDYESVKADIEAWKSHALHYICGHDVHMPGVQKALEDLGVKYETRGTVWWANVD